MTGATPHRHRWQTLGTTRVCSTCDTAQMKVKNRWVPFVPTCQWFAGCDSPATTTTDHPILGDVPTCDSCAAFVAALR